MDGGGPSRRKHPTAPPSDGRGREVEDHELFGHLFISRSPRPKQRLQRQETGLQATRRQEPKKRPRSTGAWENSQSDIPTSLEKSMISKKKQAGERRRSLEIDIVEGTKSNKGASRKEKATRSGVDASRQGCSPSPRTYDEIVGRFAAIGDTSKMDGVPRLSSLALVVAKTYAAIGKLVDLSDLADSHVHEILGHKDMGAAALMKLEKLNPSRINVLEASWARLVLNEFGQRELPPGINWWRTFYEMKTRENEISLERARARLKQRYDAADADRNKRNMKTTRALGIIGKRNTKTPPNTTSRIAQLRMEMKRKRKKR